MKIHCIALLLAAVLVKDVSPSAKLTVKLVTYKNPKLRLANGLCCEQQFTESTTRLDENCENPYDPKIACPMCEEQCDNKFSVHACLLDNGQEFTKLHDYESTVVEMNNDDITFPKTMIFSRDTIQDQNNRVINNPYEFDFAVYKGAFRVNITVEDDDGYETNQVPAAPLGGSGTEMVAKFLVDVEAAPEMKDAATEKNKTSIEEYTFADPIRVDHNVTLVIQYKIWCDEFYYPPTCETKCEAHDTDQDGHYTCSNEGGKVCNNCWKEADCKTKDTEGQCGLSTVPPTTQDPGAVSTGANNATTKPAEATNPTDPSTIAPTTKANSGGPGDSGAQGGEPSDPTAAIVTPIVILAALAGAAGAAYYFVMRKKKRKNKVEDSTMDLSGNAEAPAQMSINSPEA